MYKLPTYVYFFLSYYGLRDIEIEVIPFGNNITELSIALSVFDTLYGISAWTSVVGAGLELDRIGYSGEAIGTWNTLFNISIISLFQAVCEPIQP